MIGRTKQAPQLIQVATIRRPAAAASANRGSAGRRPERVLVRSAADEPEVTMSRQPVITASRRRMLQFLAASPLFAREAVAEALRSSDPMEWAPRGLEKLIAEQGQALDVFDFEPVMRRKVPPAHSATWLRAPTTRSRCGPTARGSANSSCGRGGTRM